MIILVVNCGSSSAKYQLIDVTDERPLAKGIVERIGQKGSTLRHQAGGRALEKSVPCRDHYVAIEIIVDTLTDPEWGCLKSRDMIDGIGHRIVHGGEEFKESTLITAKVVRSVERYAELAPLHNPPSLLGIRACARILKGVPQVGVFDTSFHQTMPRTAFLYGLPISYYRKYGVRRYGFHGTSHRYVAYAAAQLLKKPIAKLKLITCHLGNGCSMTAVRHGRSVDTTMGFTPLEGLIMGTRSGDVDPAVILYIMEKEGIGPDEVGDLLNKKSGLLGLSGVGNDMRDLLKAVASGGRRGDMARTAIDVFVYRIEKYIGAYIASMKGLDAVVFTAGISENNPWLVRRIERDLKGIVPRGAKFVVVPTNEELLIARDTYRIIRKGA